MGADLATIVADSIFVGGSLLVVILIVILLVVFLRR